MFSVRKSKFLRSFVFYLLLGYVAVYAVSTAAVFLLTRRGIVKSARGYDRQDVIAESKDLVSLLEENLSGNLLAEAVTVKHYPPSTFFIVRILNKFGREEYTMSWPRRFTLPAWRGTEAAPLPPEGISEFFVESYKRHIQIQTTHLKDGRALQVGKGSFLELDQKGMMLRTLEIFAALSTLFSVLSALVMLFLTVRPIRKMTGEMTRIIETGEFERGAPPVRSMIGELDTLGHLFNVMTEKYANLIRAMRQTMENVAHDFRTPLTRIRGGCELALSRRDLPDGLADTLADVIEDCDHAKMQLQNLLDAREMESGFVKLSRETFSFSALLRDLVDMYSLIAEDKGIELRGEFPAEDVPYRGDRQRLTRAFANLIDNAVKYTPKGGRVLVSLARDADGVRVEVSDTGIGIPEDEQGLIWQRLFRGKAARETEKGLGLGLDIVRVIVAAHGGSITLRSTPGEGSTFTVHL